MEKRQIREENDRKDRNKDEQILGRISSFESMGLVDGPGIRFVVFMQGCQLRCKYCHNPETWRRSGGEYYSPEKLLEKIERFRPYFGEDGGVTFSGGEPLLQPIFLLECLKKCKEKNIHTALDTSGVGIADRKMLEQILRLCDLVILDVKATEEEEYKALTGQSMIRFNEFLNIAQMTGSKLWLRQVIVPKLNDTEENIEKLAEYIRPLKNVERVELLPFKNVCESKYKSLGMKFAFEGKENMNEGECARLESLLRAKLLK